MFVPYRRQRSRIALWERLRAVQWDGWRVVECDDGSELFSRGRAVNAAADTVDWDVAVVIDADTIPSLAVEEACRVALRENVFVVPHDRLVYAPRDATQRFIETGTLPADEMAEMFAVTQVWCTGGFVISRALWDKVGGFDDRFYGYGSADVALYVTCATLAGAKRLEGSAAHLWHETPSSNRHPGWEKNMELTSRYLAAAGRKRAIRRLLAERDAWRS